METNYGRIRQMGYFHFTFTVAMRKRRYVKETPKGKFCVDEVYLAEVAD